MLYTVKVLKWDSIQNIHHTNDLTEANELVQYQAKQWGKDRVWVCDNLQEIMVG